MAEPTAEAPADRSTGDDLVRRADDPDWENDFDCSNVLYSAAIYFKTNAAAYDK